MAITTNVPSDKFEDLQRDVQDATRFVNANEPFQNRTGKMIKPLPLIVDEIEEVFSGINNVRSVQHLKLLESQSLIGGMEYSVSGFYPGTNYGGGVFIWDPTKDCTEHNGGEIISLDSISFWDGTRSNLSILLNWTGGGFGCFVKKQNTYDMDDFGYFDHSGEFDDSLIFRALINSELPVVSKRKNQRYAIKSPCIFSDLNYVDCDFSDNEFVSYITSSFRCIAFISSLTDLTEVMTFENNVSSIGSKKGVRLLIGDSSSFNVGDHVRLISNDQINPRFAQYEKCGQSFEVVKKDGNYLYLDSNTKLNFSSNVRVLKHNKGKKLNFHNAKFSHVSKNGVGSVQVLFDIVTYSSPCVGNIFFKDTSAMGLRFQSTFKARVKGYVSGDDMPGNTSNNQVGYVLVSSGTRGNFDLVYGRRVRHCFTSTAEDISDNSIEFEKYGGSVDDKITNVIGVECHSFAADTHSDAVDIVFDSVICESNSQERGEQTGALQFRGRYNYAGRVTHVGNNMAVFYNLGFDKCHVAEINSFGGQAFSVAGLDSSEIGTIGKICLKSNDDNIYGIRFQNNFKLISIDEYNVSLENENISIGTKLLIDILGQPTSSLHIKKMNVDSRSLKSGMLSSFVPIQIQSDIDTVTIEQYTQFNGEAVAANRGINSFIQVAGATTRRYNLNLLNALFFTHATTISSASPSIKGGSLHSNLSKINVNYSVHGSGFNYFSNKKRFSVFTQNMFVPHCFNSSNASQVPYVNQFGNIETTLIFSTGGSCYLQPPSYVGQKWLLVIPQNNFTGTSLTIGTTVINLPSNLVIELECVNNDEWSINYQK